MNYEDLRKNAQEIIDNVPSGDLVDHSFMCSSGGVPSNRLGLPVISRSSDFKYSTTANGDAYSGELILRCRKIDQWDRDNLQIFEHENGEVFVFKYLGGCPSSFDGGAIRSPNF